MGQRGPSKRIASIRARIGRILFQSLEAPSRAFRTTCFCFVLVGITSSRACGVGGAATCATRKGSRRSVSRVLSMVCTTGRPFLWDVPCGTPRATNPGGGSGNSCFPALPQKAGRPYSVLLPVGFTLPALLPGPRCALTAPFHPCHRTRRFFRRFVFCGTVPGVAPAGR